MSNPYVHKKKKENCNSSHWDCGRQDSQQGLAGKKKCSFFSLGLTCYFLSLSDMLDGCDGNDDCDDIKRKREREKRACSNNRSRSGDDDG